MTNNVLIVDDTPENLRVLTAMLHDRGYKVRPATSGAIALKACLAQPPDLILLDINMPEMNGYEVCARLKEHPALREIPVLFISALTEKEDKVQAFRAGGVDYITKPFQIEEVEARVAAHLALHRQRQELTRVAEELQAKNDAIAEDIAMARELQIALLPQQFPIIPIHQDDPITTAVHFHSLYRPSASLSGDFFDVFAIGDHKAGLLICDVMGHGVRAALVATILQAQVRALKSSWSDPAMFMNELNRVACRVLKNTHTTLFASAFYGVADLSEGTFTYANAGHPWPLRIDSFGQTHCSSSLECSRRGPALGLFHGAQFASCETTITPPETFLFFTDGLFEVEAPDGAIYDYESLRVAVEEVAAADLTNLCERVVDRVTSFSGRHEFADDVCLISMTVDNLIAQPTNRDLALV